jgi:hypothetical protein
LSTANLHLPAVQGKPRCHVTRRLCRSKANSSRLAETGRDRSPHHARRTSERPDNPKQSEAAAPGPLPEPETATAVMELAHVGVENLRSPNKSEPKFDPSGLPSGTIPNLIGASNRNQGVFRGPCSDRRRRHHDPQGNEDQDDAGHRKQGRQQDAVAVALSLDDPVGHGPRKMSSEDGRQRSQGYVHQSHRFSLSTEVGLGTNREDACAVCYAKTPPI